MINVLIIAICVMSLITVISSVVGTVILTKYTKSEKIVGKVLKIIGIILLILIVIGGAVGVSYMKDDSASSEETVTLETAGFNEVTLDEYLSLIKEDEQNIILVARPTCTYCELFTPTLKQAMDDMKLTINYIDTDKFNEAFKSGLFDKLYSTNLTYVDSEVTKMPWYKMVDCSSYASDIIDTLNSSGSISELKNGKQKIIEMLDKKIGKN